MTTGSDSPATPCAYCGMALADAETHVCDDCVGLFGMCGVEASDIEVSEHLRSESDE